MTSIWLPRFDFRNDFTSPWHKYGKTISNIASSCTTLTPIRLITFGWLNSCAITHSLMNSLILFDEMSIVNTLQCDTSDKVILTFQCFYCHIKCFAILCVNTFIDYAKCSWVKITHKAMKKHVIHVHIHVTW